MAAAGLLMTKDNFVTIGKKHSSRVREMNALKSLAFGYTTPKGEVHWVTGPANGAVAEGRLAGAHLHSITVTETDRVFAKLLSYFIDAMSATKSPLEFLLGMQKAGVPLMREKTFEILASNHQYRSTIADMVFHRDIDKYAAVVHVSDRNKDRIDMPTWIGEVDHITMRWFGCYRVDEALTVKMSFDRVTIIEL